MSLRLATGQAAFAGDHALAGLLHVALRRSSAAHARVVSADGEAARALPGVAAVLTHEDAPRVLGDVARYVGDRLAVAAAEERELARRAAELVELKLEPLPAHLDVEAAAADDAAVVARVATGEGDVERALGEAELVVDAPLALPAAPAIPLEPPLVQTWLDEERRLVVRSAADSPFRVRGLLAKRLSLPAARIRVVRPAVAGGGLGRSDLAVEDACALVTLRTGRPAQLALTPGEALATAPGRPAQRVQLRLGLTRGEIVALDVRLLVDVGAECNDAPALLDASGRHALGLYRIPNLRFQALAVRTNRPPAAAPRGTDAAVALALEYALDEAALRLSLDPGAWRRALLRRPGDAGGTALAALGEPPGGDDARPLAELLHELGDEQPTEPAAATTGPLRRARGVAVARRADAPLGCAGAASLRLLDDGSLTLAAFPTAIAGADELLYADTVAAILGIPARRVVCAAPDTDSLPYLAGDDAPAGSAAGRAVEQAATLARDRILEAGAALLGVPVERATLADGRVAGPMGRTVDLAEIGTAALRAGEPLAVTAAPPRARVPHSLAAVAAEVELDAPTGVVRVRELAAVVAGGPFEDARQAAAQVEGALASALEQALTGVPAAPDPARPPLGWPRGLPLVTAADVPPLRVRFMAGPDPLSRFGTAAHAEAAARAALAALAAAVARAAAARPRELPLDPPRLLLAMAGAGEQ